MPVVASTCRAKPQSQLAALTAVVLGQDDGDWENVNAQVPVHPLTDLADEAPFVDTYAVFPNHPGKSLPIGQPVTAVCGFVNHGDEPVQVSAIMGSLNSPFMFDMYIQNVTSRFINQTVGARGEYNFAITFTPREDLDAVDLVLALTLFYEDEDETYTSTFFNETVSFYEASGDVDVQAVIQIAGLVGGLAAILFFAFRGTGKSKPRTERGTVGGSDFQAEWLPEGVKATSSSSRRRKKQK